MQECYPIPSYVLDAYNKCEFNLESKSVHFPRRQFANASKDDPRIQAWFDTITKEVGLDLSPNNIFQLCIRRHLTRYVPAKCLACGKLLSINSAKIGVEYCSVKCAQSAPEIVNKRKATSIERYGVDNPNKSKEVRAKTAATNLARYGGSAPICSKEVRDKIKQTNLERYGTENVYAASAIREQIKKTNLERYGVDNPNKSKEVRAKTAATNRERYGGNAPLCSDEVKAKAVATNLERYGVTNPNKTTITRAKIVATSLERYGGNAPLCSDNIKTKVKQTNLEKYGVDCPLGSPEIKEKSIRTRKENYYPKFLALLLQKNIELLSCKKDYVDKATLRFRCNYCSTEWIKDYTAVSTAGVNGITCPHCIKTYVSKEEKDLLAYIKTLYSGTIVSNDRKLIKPYELDIYLPKKKLAFEFNGVYWHSDQVVPRGYHFSKTRLCSKKHVRLIHIFEYEWLFNQEKVKALIKSALGIFDVRLYARKCNVKPISSFEYKEFLSLYHLQGVVNSSIRYGLFYKDELVSVIGFGKSRFKQGEIELHRYCVKANYQIIGGFSKLIKYTCKESNISEFISYVDLAHFSGRGYKKIGFTLAEVTKPSYVYIKNDEVKTRMQCQKHKLSAFLKSFNEELSESDNMSLNGWYKVYDCGNLKLKYTLQI